MGSERILARAGSTVGRAGLFVAFVALFATGLAAAPPAGARPSEDRNPNSSETIALGSRTVELTLNHSAGGLAWDGRVRDLVVTAGTVPERLIGLPYPRPDRDG